MTTKLEKHKLAHPTEKWVRFKRARTNNRSYYNTGTSKLDRTSGLYLEAIFLRPIREVRVIFKRRKLSSGERISEFRLAAKTDTRRIGSVGLALFLLGKRNFLKEWNKRNYGRIPIAAIVLIPRLGNLGFVEWFWVPSRVILRFPLSNLRVMRD